MLVLGAWGSGFRCEGLGFWVLLGASGFCIGAFKLNVKIKVEDYKVCDFRACRAYNVQVANI